MRLRRRKTGRGVPARRVSLQARIGAARGEGRNRKRPCFGTQLVQSRRFSGALLPALGARFALVQWGKRRSFTISTVVIWISTCSLRCKRIWKQGLALLKFRDEEAGTYGLEEGDGY